eukprot:gene9624-10640_t
MFGSKGTAGSAAAEKESAAAATASAMATATTTALTPEQQQQQQQQTAVDNRFSLIELRRIHAQLVENKNVHAGNENLVVEILRVLAEMVVYGDRKSELLFDYFCEKNMLQLFLDIMWSAGGCPAAVHVQILQTLSILISSVKNDTSLYYLLSNNHINDVIVFPHDMTAEESLCEQYVSFIKTLSLRLNEQTVQFFFIEDTGAFPILTKSVEMLKQKDPMVRIAAQTAILNIYKVHDHRARQFALQEEVMTKLFQVIIDIMNEQVESLCELCKSYGKLTQENDENGCNKLEQTLSDSFISLEDWLYYVQDLLGLGIEIFGNALLNYIVDCFVAPVLLASLLYLRPYAEDDFLPLRKMTNLDSQSGEKEVKTTDSSSSLDPKLEAEHFRGCICIAYLLQMIRIVGSSHFTESVLTVLLHPLDKSSLDYYATVDVIEGASVEKAQGNPYRYALAGLYHAHGQRLALLASYLLYSLFSSFREQRKRELSDVIYSALGTDENQADIVDNSQEIADCDLLRWFEILRIAPAGQLEKQEWKQGKIQFYRDLDRFIVNPFLQNGTKQGSGDYFFVNMATMLKSGHKFSLAAVQAMAFSLSLLLSVMTLSEPSRQSTPEPSPSSKEVFVEGIDTLPASTTENGSGDNLVEVEERGEKAESTAVEDSQQAQPQTMDLPLETPRFTVLKEVREACRSAAQSLLARLSTSFSEVMLVLINEEIKRFAGRQWKTCFQRMSTSKLLFLPPTPTHLATLGIDFDMPISQTETIRKEVQIFLLLRALFKLHLSQDNVKPVGNAVTSKGLPREELSQCVRDQDLLCLEENNMISSQYCLGMIFEMKGRKFLDAVVHVQVSTQTDTTTTATASSFTSSIFFGWGSASSSSRRGSSFSSPTKSGRKAVDSPARSATSSPAPPTTTKMRLLFVQDPDLLILTCQDKTAGKSVFRIHILAPLLYTDAKVDLLDRRKLKVLVRSWKPMANMNKLELDFSEGGAGLTDMDLVNSITTHSSHLTNALYGDNSDKLSPASAKRVQMNNDSYLKPCEKSQLWQISLVMDTEQACSLAVQHIESRRKAITAQKVDKLRSVLSNWALDAFDVLVEAERVEN